MKSCPARSVSATARHVYKSSQQRPVPVPYLEIGRLTRSATYRWDTCLFCTHYRWPCMARFGGGKAPSRGWGHPRLLRTPLKLNSGVRIQQDCKTERGTTLGPCLPLPLSFFRHPPSLARRHIGKEHKKRKTLI
jgi:hypothetical protein